MTGDVLIAPCPICGQSYLAGSGLTYSCASCGTQVTRSRWLGVWSRNRFFFRTIGADYRNTEPDLAARSFTKTQLAELTNTCYTDADLAAIADGDFSRLRPPSSIVSQVMFPLGGEKCYVQLNGLVRAEGPSLAIGMAREREPANRHSLQMLDRGNLFISEQRLIFPSGTHTIIRFDARLTGVRAYADAVAIQRKGEGKATYFLDLECRNALLVAAYLQGRLEHLRQPPSIPGAAPIR